MMALLASSSYLPGRGGGVSRRYRRGGGWGGGNGTAGPGSNEFGLARLGAALGPNGLISGAGAGHKRRRYETNHIGNATCDERQQLSSGEVGYKRRKKKNTPN
jgi:hypothetical protein